MKKFSSLFAILAIISCKEQQETYKELSVEIPTNSKEQIARLIKKQYPVYEKYNDTILVNKYLEKYPYFKKAFEHSDKLKVKMELAKIDAPKCNSCYYIYWRAERTLNIGIPIPAITSINILSENKVKLLDLCNNCKWESVNENTVTDGKKTIESIDIWNKLNRISFEVDFKFGLLNVYRVNEFGEEDPNGKYWVDEFGEEMVIDPKTGDFILRSETCPKGECRVTESDLKILFGKK